MSISDINIYVDCDEYLVLIEYRIEWMPFFGGGGAISLYLDTLHDFIAFYL